MKKGKTIRERLDSLADKAAKIHQQIEKLEAEHGGGLSGDARSLIDAAYLRLKGAEWDLLNATRFVSEDPS